MHFSTLLTAALATVAAAYTQPKGSTPSGNPIFTPSLGEAVPAGTAYNITWNPTTQGTVTILLLRGPSNNVVPLFPIVEKAANLGYYVYTFPTSKAASILLSFSQTQRNISKLLPFEHLFPSSNGTNISSSFQASPPTPPTTASRSSTTPPAPSNTARNSASPTKRTAVPPSPPPAPAPPPTRPPPAASAPPSPSTRPPRHPPPPPRPPAPCP